MEIHQQSLVSHPVSLPFIGLTIKPDYVNQYVQQLLFQHTPKTLASLVWHHLTVQHLLAWHLVIIAQELVKVTVLKVNMEIQQVETVWLNVLIVLLQVNLPFTLILQLNNTFAYKYVLFYLDYLVLTQPTCVSLNVLNLYMEIKLAIDHA